MIFKHIAILFLSQILKMHLPLPVVGVAALGVGFEGGAAPAGDSGGVEEGDCPFDADIVKAHTA